MGGLDGRLGIPVQRTMVGEVSVNVYFSVIGIP